ncbi:aldose 1-epimerase family protein [Paenarthrobacter sp. DKR-5]|uniref:aldose 1-epimerase family protein n=1 Tax=Paenarthrobacter sp. DKR-5 TaxID=2835535 RepID=UPI001BDD3D94|nr:aldose 1-epimerase family protein [Paenarthrobacter sp. DKR-5]MBT1002386.1 aldose 1-epimerase family protein [Paenarthrobacter sp. DKR-5]
MTDEGCATGTQYVLRRGGARAVVVELAAGLRRFSVDGVDLTESYPDSELPPGAAGITLAPWANRIRDGRWTLDGKVQQLDLTEPARGNATHGLLRNTGYQLVSRSADAVELEATVFPQHGYPFRLRHRVRYALTGPSALQVEQTLHNLSTARAPFVLGAHPYLRIGELDSSDLTLTVRARSYLPADEQKIPGAPVPVDAGHDLSAGRRIGDLLLDAAYTGLDFDRGPVRHVLAADDGRSVTLWADASCGFVQVFVTDTFPGRRRAVALEPMTGPADAFNSGLGLRWLDPGASFTFRWGIEADLG